MHIGVMDVASRESVEAFFKSLPEDFQKIDILVNNAGPDLSPGFGPGCCLLLHC